MFCLSFVIFVFFVVRELTIEFNWIVSDNRVVLFQIDYYILTPGRLEINRILSAFAALREAIIVRQ